MGPSLLEAGTKKNINTFNTVNIGINRSLGSNLINEKKSIDKWG